MTRITSAYRSGFNGRPGWRVAFGYDEEAIERLKAIPAAERSYDPDTHEWWFSDQVVEDAWTILPSLRAFVDQPALF